MGEGPRAAAPGEVVLLPTEDEKAAAALLVDLAVVPVEHGLCTFKPVAGGSGLPLRQAVPHLRAFRSHRSGLQLLETPGATAGGARRRRPRNDLQRKLEAARANLARLTKHRVAELFPHGPREAAAVTRSLPATGPGY